MDLCTSLDFDVLSQSFIRRAYANVGNVVNVYPWNTKKNRHYYCEFASLHEVEAARNLPVMRGVVASAARHDPQHLNRFKQLVEASNRYAPYELRSGRAVASSPTRDIHGPSTSNSNQAASEVDRPRNDLGQALEEGEISASDSMAKPTITIPILGEAVRFPLGNVATASAVSALLSASASEQSFARIPSPPRLPPSSASHSQTAQEMISQLSDLRESWIPTSVHPNGISEKSANQYRIDPKFDFRHHITSILSVILSFTAKIASGGRFLSSEAKADGLDAQSFEPTPLQSYFADIYGNLQTDLHEAKRRIREQELELERMKLLCQRYEDELAEARAARRDAEAKVDKLMRQLQQSGAHTLEQRKAIERCNSLLDVSRSEVERLQRGFSQIQTICEVSLDQKALLPSSAYPSS